jgi:peroxiredoxin family protein
MTDETKKTNNRLSLKQLDERLSTVEEKSNNATIVLFSGDFDKIVAAYIIATGYASMGLKVNIFHTFWGLSAIKGDDVKFKGKGILEKGISMMMPSSPDKTSTSSMDMMGFGPALFKTLMDKHGVADVKELIATARELEVRLYACEMAANLMGLEEGEIVEGVEMVGVMKYAEMCKASNIQLFI